jgi:hypothetical protein
MKKKLLAGLIAALCMLGVSVMAQATILSPGYTSLSGTTVAVHSNLAGTIVEDELSSFWDGGVQGTVQTRVVLSVDGTYDFYWRIRDTSGNGLIDSLRIGDFFTTTYDADFRTDGLGNIGPDRAYLDPNNDGNINFRFMKGIDAGANKESLFFFLDTDAHNYAKTAQFDLVSRDYKSEVWRYSPSFATYAPAPVPVPGTLLLLGSGIIGLVGFRRKRD